MKCKTLLLFSLMLATSEFTEAQVRRKFGRATGQSTTMKHGNRDREYRIHVPAGIRRNKSVPLVVMLHGGGGDSRQSSRMGMSEVADSHGFIVVYPNAIDKHWNGGRVCKRFEEHDARIDDVAFITSVVEKVSKDHKIDANRVFVTGVSNGGFMSQRLAMERSKIFSAAGIVIATMGEPINRSFKPERPVSMLFMNGTEDPLVPYDGGNVNVELFPKLAQLRRDRQPNRGKCIATIDAVNLWRKRNGLTAKTPIEQKLADADTNDGSRIHLTMWTGGADATAVALYKVEGGGHVIPGGIQYLPEKLIGKANGDIDGLTVIWDFFAQHGRKAE